MSLDIRPTAREVHRLIFRPKYEVMPVRCWLRPMLDAARQWEVNASWAEARGDDAGMPPFRPAIMNFLANINESRVAAERRHAARQRQAHLEAAQNIKRREAQKPHVSRRVLHERRQRAIDERRTAASADAGAASSGAGVEADGE